MTIGDYVDRIETINRCKKLTWILNNYFNSNRSNMESFEQHLEDIHYKNDFHINDLNRATTLLNEYAEMLKKIVVDNG